jgi:HSP20 family protein
MKFDEIKEGVSALLDSVAEGWRHLRESAANALTRFKPNEASRLPAKAIPVD